MGLNMIVFFFLNSEYLSRVFISGGMNCLSQHVDTSVKLASTSSAKEQGEPTHCAFLLSFGSFCVLYILFRLSSYYAHIFFLGLVKKKKKSKRSQDFREC